MSPFKHGLMGRPRPTHHSRGSGEVPGGFVETTHNLSQRLERLVVEYRRDRTQIRASNSLYLTDNAFF